jgi:transcriptional regulator with XRE-family HTH domain
MKVTAITRYKQGDLFAALKKLKCTQKEFAEDCGMGTRTFSAVINMRQKPSQESARKIQDALLKHGIFLNVLDVWPEAFEGFKDRPVSEETKEVREDLLLMYAGQRTETPMLLENNEIRDLLDSPKLSLTVVERFALKHHFFENENLEELGESLAKFSDRKQPYNRERARQIIQKALLKLRRWHNVKILSGYKDRVTTSTVPYEAPKEMDAEIAEADPEAAAVAEELEKCSAAP